MSRFLLFLMLLRALNFSELEGSSASDVFISKMKQLEERNTPHKKMLRMAFVRNRECLPLQYTHWLCNGQCQLTVSKNSSIADSCLIPNGLQRCFDQTISYNYTLNETAGKHLDYLRVLQRFPRCWSKIAPLVCSIIYRPCQAVYVAMPTEVDEVMLEVRQIFAHSFCTAAESECAFVVELGLWPDFIDCDSKLLLKYTRKLVPANETQIATSQLFNDNCKLFFYFWVPYNKSSPGKAQCLWPLVNDSSGSVSVDVRPLIDGCYLPCRSPVIESEYMYTNFRWINFLLALIFAVIFACLTSYLWLFSQMYLVSYEIFLLTQSFLCIAAYYSMWAFLSTNSLQDAAVCAADGSIRNQLPRIVMSNFSSLRNIFSLCAAEAALLLFLPFCAYAWLSAFFLHRCVAPDFRSADYVIWCGGGGGEKFPSSGKTLPSSRNKYRNLPANARGMLALVIYSFGIALALFTILLFEIPADGITRVCHFAARNSRFQHHLHLVYTPIFVLNILVLGVILFCYLSNKRSADKSKRGCSNCAQNSDGSSNPSSSISTTKVAVFDSERPLLANLAAHPQGANENGHNAGNLRHVRDRRRVRWCGLEISCLFNNTGRNADESVSGESFINDLCFLLAVFANAIFCCMGMYALFNSPAAHRDENQIILQSINCSLKSTIALGSDLQWTKAEGWKRDMTNGRVDPYLRKAQLNGSLSAPNCGFEYIEAIQLFHFSALLLIYPALPFIFLFFFAILNGRNSNAWRKIRQNIFSCRNSFDEPSFSTFSSASGSRVLLKNLDKKIPSTNHENNNGKIFTPSQLSGTSEASARAVKETKVNHSNTSDELLNSPPGASFRKSNFVGGEQPPPPSIDSMTGLPANFPADTADFYGAGAVSGVGVTPPFMQNDGVNYCNPYGGYESYLSASTGNLPATNLPMSHFVNISGNGTVYENTSSTANSDPIHKSGERKIDLNEHYRMHRIQRQLAANAATNRQYLELQQMQHQLAQRQLRQASCYPQPLMSMPPQQMYLSNTVMNPTANSNINNGNFFSDTASMRSMNSSATFNMTSISQQPTVIPNNIDPGVINAVFVCGFQQGAIHAEQKLEERIDELTNKLNHFTVGFQHILFGKQQEMCQNQMADFTTMMTSASATMPSVSTLNFDAEAPVTVPMVFGTQRQEAVREFNALSNAINTVKNGGTTSCVGQNNEDYEAYNAYENNNAKLKMSADDGELGEDGAESSDFVDDDEGGVDGDEEELDGDDSTTEESDRLSDEYNSDESDPAEEMFNKTHVITQIEKLSKQGSEVANTSGLNQNFESL